jgi:glucose/arabinose dehydrogenase
MRKLLLPIFLLLILTLQSLHSPHRVLASPPADFQTSQIIGSGLTEPTGFDIAPDGRIFILERLGAVRIYKNGQLLSTPFVTLPSTNFGDKGLIGITFDPDFANNKWVYFYYSASDSLNHVVRFDATNDTATGSAVQIYQTNTVSPQYHIGGTIRFGSDGKLYLSIGDNGTPSNSQSLANPFGKIIRLNKDGTIPADNPFVGQSGKLPEIWAYGLRNPFRFQFDSVTGRLYEGDVGANTWEEVNLIQKGNNYGWPTCEGTCNVNGMTNPIYTYNHNGGSMAISGGPVYQGNMFPASYKGNYFFGDYAAGFIKRLTLDANGNMTGVSDFDTNAGSVVDFKVATDGSLYYLTIFPGNLFRVTYTLANQFPTAVASSDKTEGPEPLTVNFSSAGSSDPENKPLIYDWNLGDGTHSALANPSKIYNNKGAFTVILTVSDGVNSVQAAPIIIQAGKRPDITITSPTDGATYKAGDSFNYNATGTDGGGTALPDSAFTTDIIFHHGTHIHPFLGPLQSRSGTFTTTFSGEPSADTWYEVRVTGKDTNGLFTTKSVFVYPIKVNITYDTSPSGITILLDGQTTNTPLSVDQVVGYQRQLTAPTIGELNGNIYHFKSWSDGGKPIHTITIPGIGTTYTAIYELSPPFNAEYYNNMNLTGTPVLTRQDKKIDFTWVFGSPDPAVNADQFSVRWSKQQYFVAGKYKFVMTGDDGVRLYIDNVLVIDKWINQSATSYELTTDLSDGNHAIKMEFYDNTEDATAILTWSYVGDISVVTPTPTPTPTPIPVLPPTGSYSAQYWNTPGAGSAPTIPLSPPALTRIDSDINFDWGLNSSGTGVNTDHFVARWTKSDLFEQANYRFTATADDGIRVFVDGQAVIDAWKDQSVTTYTKDVNMTAGNHTLIVEFYDNTQEAVAKFSYAKFALSSQVSGLKGEYYNNKDFTAFVLNRIDPTVNFSWGSGSPNAAIGPDTFSVRWTGQIQPQFSQTYTFYTSTDDGVRLWVNGQLLIDKWIDQGTKEWSGTINLSTGQKYDIKMEYYENGGGAVAQIRWSSPSRSKQIIPQANLFTAP